EGARGEADRPDPGQLRADPEGDHRHARPAPPDLPRDGPPRPLRPRVAAVLVGEDRPRRGAAEGRGDLKRAGSVSDGQTESVAHASGSFILVTKKSPRTFRPRAFAFHAARLTGRGRRCR